MTTNYPKVQGPAQPIWVPDGVEVLNTVHAPVPVNIPNTLADAFGRLRVSNPQTLFNSTVTLSSQPLFWENITTGGGSVTHVPARAAMELAVAGASGDKQVRQTHGYIRYQPGKSQQILMTFALGPRAPNIRRRVGYFDDNNGVFLEQTSAGLFFVLRSKVSGVVVDTRIAQADWNKDALVGLGDSRITLNEAYTQILVIDLEWLGVGSLRVGFMFGGEIVYAHQFYNANVMSTVYMQSAHLPARYALESTGASDAATMDAICLGVNSEGGREDRNLVLAKAMLASRLVTNTPLPLLSIRVATTFPSGGTLVNRETVIPTEMKLLTEDAAILWQLIYNGTLTAPSWVAVNTTHSGVEYDISASGITGGVVVDAGYAVATNQSQSSVFQRIQSDLIMALNAAGTIGDTFSVVGTRLTATSSDTWAMLNWKELY